MTALKSPKNWYQHLKFSPVQAIKINPVQDNIIKIAKEKYMKALTMASDEPSTDHLVISPFLITRAADSDNLKWPSSLRWSLDNDIVTLTALTPTPRSPTEIVFAFALVARELSETEVLDFGKVEELVAWGSCVAGNRNRISLLVSMLFVWLWKWVM